MNKYHLVMGYRIPTQFPAPTARATHTTEIEVYAETIGEAKYLAIELTYKKLNYNCEHVHSLRVANIPQISDK